MSDLSFSRVAENMPRPAIGDPRRYWRFSTVKVTRMGGQTFGRRGPSKTGMYLVKTNTKKCSP
jgi:hypothetical protein